MKFKTTLFFLLISLSLAGQIKQKAWLDNSKAYSKDISLYRAKYFIMSEVLGVDNKPILFDIDPLAATSSGELTSLVYSCVDKKITGLVLGFYGDRWNEAGVVYQSYAYKNLTAEQASEILTRLSQYIKSGAKYLSADSDNNNIFFKYDDLTFLIYRDGGVKIRVFWNDFDAEWQSMALERTRRRFEKSKVGKS